MRATTLFLLRHAAHDRVDQVLCGRMPGVHLGAEGRAQAERLGTRLEGEGLAAIYASPQPRALETAEAVAARLPGLSVVAAADLDEIDVGTWTGGRFADLSEDPAWQRWNAARATASAPGAPSTTRCCISTARGH